MRALVYAGPGKLKIEDRPRMKACAGEVEIQVEVACVCGTDISAFLGRSRSSKPPMILGHEFVGRTPRGERVVIDPLLSCGQCVECERGATNLCGNLRLLGMGSTAGCFAESVVVPESQLHPISRDLDDKLAILAEPLANVVHLFRNAPRQPDFRVGIIGAGTMGAMALQLALHHGVRDVLVEEIDEQRRAVAEKMGATLAGNPSRSATDVLEYAGLGLDVVVDACGTAEARQRAFNLCRPGGTVVLVGLASGQSELDFAASIRKEHRVFMSFGYTREDFARSLELLSSGAIDLREWTAEMPLDQGQQAFERMACSRGDTLKMMLRP